MAGGQQIPWWSLVGSRVAEAIVCVAHSIKWSLRYAAPVALRFRESQFCDVFSEEGRSSLQWVYGFVLEKTSAPDVAAV